MDLWSIVFGALMMLEALLVLDAFGRWRDGNYKECAENVLLGAYLWAAFLLHHWLGVQTTKGLVLLAVLTAVYAVTYKGLQRTKN